MINADALRRVDTKTAAWLFAETLSHIGDQIFIVALIWTTLQKAGLGDTTWVILAGAIPSAVLMLVGGAAVDRLDPRRVAMVSDYARCVLIIGAAFIVLIDPVPIPVLIGLSALVGICDAFFYPASGAIPPMLAQPVNLLRLANLRNLGMRVAAITGPPLGGILLTVFGPSWCFLINAFTFAVSAIIIGRLRLRAVDPSPDAASTSMVAEIFGGLRYVGRKPLLATLLVAAALIEFAFNGLVNIGFPLLADIRNWGPVGYGTLVACVGAGATVVAVVLSARGRVPRPGITIVIAATIAAIAVLGFAQTPSLVFAGLLVFAVGALAALVGGIAIPAVQSGSDPAYLGRTMALVSVATVGVAPLSIAVASGLSASGISTLAIVSSALCLIGAIVCLAAPAVRRMPTWSSVQTTPSSEDAPSSSPHPDN